MIRCEEDRPARDGKYSIELWPCSEDHGGARMLCAEVGRCWQRLRLAAVPFLLGDLFRDADLWLEILHLEIEPSSDGLGGDAVVRVNVRIRAVMPPDFPPRGYYSATLLPDFLHSWCDSLASGDGAGETAAPGMPLIIGVNRGGMFWRMAPAHIGQPTPIT